jgi:glyoxylate reductase
MDKRKVFITSQIPKTGVNLLLKKDFQVDIFKGGYQISSKELVKRAKDSSALICLLSDKINKKIIDELTEVKIIANYAVGFNNIDIEYARQKGIIVTNTPEVLTESTADLTLALILACSRRLKEGIELVKNRKFKGWAPQLLLGKELMNKTVGIIGMGRIGTAVAKRVKAFGCNIIYYSNNVNIEAEKTLKAKKVSLTELMKKSDIISVHIPLNSKTKNLINKQNLELMKKDAIFINTARGEVLDELHLIKMLKRKRIFSAGFDVYQNEPSINPELLKLENVVALPHIGSATHEARNKMSELVAKNVIAVLSGKKPLTPVN